MKHKYTVGTWVRFQREGKLLLGIVQYLPKKESWESQYSYITDVGTVAEDDILEARAEAP